MTTYFTPDRYRERDSDDAHYFHGFLGSKCTFSALP